MAKLTTDIWVTVLSRDGHEDEPMKVCGSTRPTDDEFRAEAKEAFRSFGMELPAPRGDRVFAGPHGSVRLVRVKIELGSLGWSTTIH